MKKLILLISLFALSACQADKKQQHSPGGQTLTAQPMSQAKPFTVTGTVLYKKFEGGFYAFDSDDGKKYTLSGLDKTLLQHGLKLKVTATKQQDIQTIQQYGQSLQVISAKVIGKANVIDDQL